MEIEFGLPVLLPRHDWHWFKMVLAMIWDGDYQFYDIEKMFL
jgi:hypothetical protein